MQTDKQLLTSPSRTALHVIDTFSGPSAYLEEIKTIIVSMYPGFDFSIINQTHADVVRLFAGAYPGYRKSNTKYHDLEHTNAVTLAAIRILHGLYLHGSSFTEKDVNLTACSALFHDTGLIQEDFDCEGSGAKFTDGHEKRSIDFMKHYFLDTLRFTEKDVTDCSHIIMCTILNLSTSTVPFRSDKTRTLGMIIGSADLLAQMADRSYLEKLPLLFQEFEEGGLSGYQSEMDLMTRTEDFYHEVAQRRLHHELKNVAENVHLHFKERWNRDRDLYTEAINNNLNHLKNLRMKCGENFECLMQNLRRRFPTGTVGK